MSETNELSEREIEILKLVATGLSNKEIAYQLKISPNTVKVHLKNIFAKIGSVSRTEAAMYAVKQGWVEAGSPVTEESDNDIVQSPKSSPSPILLSLLGVGIFAAIILLVVLVVNLAGNNQLQIVEVIVTPTPEPVRWELVTYMPEPKKSMAYAAVDNKIYIIGGETPNGVSDRVDIYDTVTNQWSEGTRKPTPVTEACGAYVGGKIIVAGGKTADGAVTNVVEAYDVFADRWERMPDLPNRLAGAGCIEYQGFYYLVGGWDGEIYYSEIWIYSQDEISWKKTGALYTPNAYLGSVIVNNMMYTIGGISNEKGVRSIDVYQIDSDSLFFISRYKTMAELSESRYLMVALTVMDKIYVLGGLSDDNKFGYSFELSINDGLQRIIPNPVGNGAYSIGGVLWRDNIYWMGGSDGKEIFNELFRLKVLYSILFPIISK